MQTFLTETLAKETKEKLQKRRNLFGLGLTSLIAACGTATESAGVGNDTGGGSTPGEGTPGEGTPGGEGMEPTEPTEPVLPVLPDAVVEAAKLSSDVESAALSSAKHETNSGFTTAKSGTDYSFTIIIGGDNTADLVFNSDGHRSGVGGIYKLTPTATQYDLVVLAPNEDSRIFVFWNMEDIEDEMVTQSSTGNERLEIKEGDSGDRIGNHAPDFLQLGGKDGYDMVIRSEQVDHKSGAIYILWDVADYATGTTKTIDLADGKLDDDDMGDTLGEGATSGSLAIYGEKTFNYIGTHAPDFLKIGGKDGYDMVIQSPYVDSASSTNTGAIYILWDVADYAGQNKTINLGKLGEVDSPPSIGEGATAGSLAIYGRSGGDRIGTHAPDFLKIGGKDGYDMVIRAPYVDSASSTNAGAIYILWDVADYAVGADKNKTINLGNLADTTTGKGAIFGSLAIHGASSFDRIGINAPPPEFLKIAGKDGYDMVIGTPNFGKASYTEEGAIYILWDVADYYGTEGSPNNRTIDLGKLDEATPAGKGATSGSLTIYGAKLNDYLGLQKPDFLKIGGKDGYDMVIRAPNVNNGAANEAGAFYILWDVADYYGTQGSPNNKTIDLGATATDVADYASSGLLKIHGTNLRDYIGSHAPKFVKIGGKDGYDMVIQAPSVDNGTANDAGAIYILWDVTDYYGTEGSPNNRTIDFGDLDSNTVGATFGSLAIYGVAADDKIGINTLPNFLQIGGKDSVDMVIRSERADRYSGAIYILWDVADYAVGADKNKTIDLGNLGDVDTATSFGEGATSGSLAIYGARAHDRIGTHAPDFLQLGGKDGYDMVIRTPSFDKASHAEEGVIYILWDVADYAAGTDKNKTIDLDPAKLADVSSGILTIYGAAARAYLGSDDNNVLYGDDGKGNKVLTDIDGNGAKDIVFQDRTYTYILFGEKVATTTDEGDGEKVTSKTIDLGKVNVDGFFEYKFGGTDTDISDDDEAETTANKTDATGYRFASGTGSNSDEGYTTLDAIKEAYDKANSSGLSNTDADLGVWDIA